MALHHTNDLIFEIPDKFKDKTNHILSLTDEGPSEFSIVINHHPIGEKESLQSYGDTMITEFQKALPEFTLIDRIIEFVAQQDSLKLEYSWVQEGQKLHQVQISFFINDTPVKRRILQLTATSINQISSKWQKVLSKILSSMQLREK